MVQGSVVRSAHMIGPSGQNGPIFESMAGRRMRGGAPALRWSIDERRFPVRLSTRARSSACLAMRRGALLQFDEAAPTARSDKRTDGAYRSLPQSDEMRFFARMRAYDGNARRRLFTLYRAQRKPSPDDRERRPSGTASCEMPEHATQGVERQGDRDETTPNAAARRRGTAPASASLGARRGRERGAAIRCECRPPRTSPATAKPFGPLPERHTRSAARITQCGSFPQPTALAWAPARIPQSRPKRPAHRPVQNPASPHPSHRPFLPYGPRFARPARARQPLVRVTSPARTAFS